MSVNSPDVANMEQRRQDAENASDPSGAAGTILCALTGKGCLEPDLLVCVEWECTPKCGDPYKVEAGKHSFTNPDTPCKCVRNVANPAFDKPLPGL